MSRWPDRLEFQLGWALLGTLIGLGYAVNGASEAAQKLLPAWALPVWVAALVGSGLAETVAALVGATTVRLARRDTALVVERAALTLQSLSVLTIGLASVYVWEQTKGQPFPVIGVSLILIWMAINARRDRRIASLIKPDQSDRPAGAAHEFVAVLRYRWTRRRHPAVRPDSDQGMAESPQDER